MKRFLLAALMVVLFSAPAIADMAKSERGEYRGMSDGFNSFMNDNEYFYHVHNHKLGIDDPYGLGLDMKIFDLKGLVDDSNKLFSGFLDSINYEYRYDFNNDNHTNYLVLKVDISNIFK